MRLLEHDDRQISLPTRLRLPVWLTTVTNFLARMLVWNGKLLTEPGVLLYTGNYDK